MLGRFSSKSGRLAVGRSGGALKKSNRTAATSYMRGDDFKPRDDINLNDVLIQACETHPDKTQVSQYQEYDVILYDPYHESYNMTSHM